MNLLALGMDFPLSKKIANSVRRVDSVKRNQKHKKVSKGFKNNRRRLKIVWLYAGGGQDSRSRKTKRVDEG